MKDPAWRAGRSLIPGALAICFLLAVIGGSIASLLALSGSANPFRLLADPYIQRVTSFTLLQAGLSTLVSVVIAIPVARALHRRRFPGRGFFIRLFGICLVLPTLVAVLGIIQIHGKNGWLNHILGYFSLDAGHYLYGLGGILLAHVFFNMPLVARGLLQSLEAVPAESWRLAQQLDMTPLQSFRLIEWPALRSALPGLAGLVLMLCFTSFVVVLALGGGPKATTTEVAIYQALRFDFDIPTAVALALIQIMLCGGAALLLLGRGHNPESELALNRKLRAPLPDGRFARWFDGAFLLIAAGLVLPPLAAVAVGGMNDRLPEVLQDPAFYRAAATSLAVALPAGMLALTLGTAILFTSRHLAIRLYRTRSARLVENTGALILVVPPFVLATGLFILLRGYTDIFSMGPFLVVVINGCMALPFVLRVVGPAFHQIGNERDRLCRSLDLRGMNRFRLAEWPVLRRPIALALALSTTLSFGDFGVIALFGSQDFTTLPLYIFRSMGAYRMDQAAVAALVLILLSFVIFQLIERGLGGRKHA
ncbi:thiamine/thiamine pyrophosphate ABC transporter permease [Aestuariispira insulae]|uniref:Thiamine transport system permease protein ThiP n=1 Tax=Aestuariispira insulae TaxID=1461337 RepID=A0A3D9HSY1_9PROT|nr:thiamine/thiamine pyrophosphate ABC transporter permease [Aestuariispira insulae]RED52525.1 thiamine transport system permease protein [Aestuariispira insulae]